MLRNTTRSWSGVTVTAHNFGLALFSVSLQKIFQWPRVKLVSQR